ncbi:MAG: replicative DNA helicase [Anaerolineaceae bacterium]
MSDQDFYSGNAEDPGVNQLFDRTMEEAVIGAILVTPIKYLDVSSILQTDDFYYRSHQWIWQAFQNLYSSDPTFDLLTVKQELEAQGHLEEVGGVEYLAGLTNQAPSSLHAEAYARNISALAARRRLLTAANEVAKLAYRKDINVDTVIDQAEQSIFGVSQERYKHDLVPIKDIAGQYYDRLTEMSLQTGVVSGLETGLKSVDKVLDGLQKSDFIIVAGRPGQGKTGFLIGIAKHVGLQLKRNVAVFSLEMSSEQMLQRLLAQATDIDSQKLRSARLSEEEMNRSVSALGVLAEANIYIDDTPAITPLQMRTKCRRLQMEYGLDLVIVDYLQLMSAEVKTDNRVQEVSYISRYLKVLARELKVPVIAAAQLSRAVESRPDRQPMLSDLRESGSLEQDADIVMFISQPNSEESSPLHTIARLAVAKHRNGPTDPGIELVFQKRLAMFRDQYYGAVPD